MTDVIAFFPGQGAQQVGMLADLAAEYPQIQSTFAEASESIHLDLWAMCQDGPAETLNQTYNTQPALLTASVALWRVRECPALNVVRVPDTLWAIFTPLVAADAIDFADAVRGEKAW